MGVYLGVWRVFGGDGYLMVSSERSDDAWSRAHPCDGPATAEHGVPQHQLPVNGSVRGDAEGPATHRRFQYLSHNQRLVYNLHNEHNRHMREVTRRNPM